MKPDAIAAAVEFVDLVRETCRDETAFRRKLACARWLVHRDESVTSLARRLGISRARCHRILNEVRALVLAGR